MRILFRVLLTLVCLCLSIAARAQGTWSALQQTAVTGMSHGFMAYQTLPLNYSGTGTKSPVLVYLHRNGAGNICYQNGGTVSAACTQLTGTIAAGGTGVQDWYNNAGFQSGYCPNGCIVVSVAADQTSDVSGLTSNWGGYQDTPGSQPNERGIIAVVTAVLATFNADPTRVYVTGDSTGGIGAQAVCLDYGAKTGTLGQQIAACMPFSGAILRSTPKPCPTNAQMAQIQGGPFQFNINGANDTATSSNPTQWVEPVFNKITALTTYPAQPLGGRAGSSPFFLLVDTTLSHDVWSTYRPLPAGKPMLDLLFLQTTASAGSGTLTGTPHATLPSGFLSTSGAQIVDGSGNNTRLACSNYDHPTANVSGDLQLIRQQGFNCVRIPYFDAILCPGGTCNFTSMDVTVAAAKAQAMKVVIYHMGNEGVNGSAFCTVQQANGMWYDSNGVAPWNGSNGTDGCGTTGTVPYTRFKANWVSIAMHYTGNSTVIGADLHHEPTATGNATCCGGGTGGTGPLTGSFSIVGGQIIDPDGKVFVARGPNVGDDEQGTASQNASCTPLRNLFPKVNHIRLSTNSTSNGGTASSAYRDPSYFANFIAQCTPFKIVVEVEDHNCNGGFWDTYVPGPLNGTNCAPETGAALQTTLNWYIAMANQYKNNPYVWFGSLNEPNSTDGTYNQSSIRPMSAYHTALYNAIRGTGSNAIIQIMAGIGGGNDGTLGSNSGWDTNAYANMHNIVWETHRYIGTPGNNLSTAFGLDYVLGSNQQPCCGGSGGRGSLAAQTVFSADGLVPVIVGEFGSQNGDVDAGSTNAITNGMIQSGLGGNPWQFGHNQNCCWDIVNESTNPFSLTSGWAQNVGAFVNSNPSGGSGGSGGGGVAGAIWGGSGGGDMRAMVNDVGGAILTANSGLLIIVEGIINPGALFNGTARGAASYPVTGGSWPDLTTVKTNPVTCCAGQLVFSVHDFPASVIGATPDSGPAAVTIRNTLWGNLISSNYAPMFVVGGASLDGTNGAANLTDEQAWAQAITQYANGQSGGGGGPTFTGCQQPISFNWQTFGNQSGNSIDGTLNADTSSRVGQANFWQTLLYTTCSTQQGGGGGTSTQVTFNPLDLAAMTLSPNKLVATVVDKSGAGQSVRSNVSQSTGKFCGEFGATTITPNFDVGIANAVYALTNTSGLGADLNGVGFDPNSAGGLQGVFFNNAVLSSGAVSSVSGEALTFCANLDTKLIWFTSLAMRGAGNAWNNSPTANPATAVGGASFSGMTGPYFMIFNNLDGSGVATINAAGPFAVSTPSGFLPWQTGVATGSGHPTLIIFGDNDNAPIYANDNLMVAFSTPMDLTQ